MTWLRESGLEAAVLKLAAAGTPVLGVCGGYQTPGEGAGGPGRRGAGTRRRMEGMGLLPCSDGASPRQKARTRVRARDRRQARLGARQLDGYENPHGPHRTQVRGRRRSACLRERSRPRAWRQGNVLGTYLHGLFDSGALTDRLAALAAGVQEGLSAAAPRAPES